MKRSVIIEAGREFRIVAPALIGLLVVGLCCISGSGSGGKADEPPNKEHKKDAGTGATSSGEPASVVSKLKSDAEDVKKRLDELGKPDATLTAARASAKALQEAAKQTLEHATALADALNPPPPVTPVPPLKYVSKDEAVPTDGKGGFKKGELVKQIKAFQGASYAIGAKYDQQLTALRDDIGQLQTFASELDRQYLSLYEAKDRLQDAKRKELAPESTFYTEQSAQRQDAVNKLERQKKDLADRIYGKLKELSKSRLDHLKAQADRTIAEECRRVAEALEGEHTPPAARN